mmetsp:Transcript_2306/g.4746  ORF Transcript_2306/g.4746 Transcript_2306/m.4746 type:complete len:395 (-) Transcript_2306:171-1355(-)
MATAVAELSGVGVDLRLGSGKGTSASSDLPRGGGVGGVRSGALGLSEELENGNVDGGKVVEDLALDRGGSGEAGDAPLKTKSLANLHQDLVGKPVHERASARTAELGQLVLLCTLALGPGTNVALNERLVVDLGNLLHLLVDLLPDTRDAEEDRRLDGLEGGAETATKGIGLGEEYLGAGYHGAVEVQHLCGNVGKGEVGDEAVCRGKGRNGRKHRLRSPAEVVVGDHHGLGLASGSGGVDEGAAVARPLSLLAHDKLVVADICPEPEEIIKGIDGNLGVDSGRDRLSVDNKSLEVLEVLLDGKVLVELLLALNNDHLGLGVSRDVLASLGEVGGVDTSGNSSGSNGSHVGNEPSRGIETDDIHGVVGFEAKGAEGLGKLVNISPVLIPSPGLP